MFTHRLFGVMRAAAIAVPMFAVATTTSAQQQINCPPDPPIGTCSIVPNKELLITELCVVNDIWRTRWDTPGAPPHANGAWTFGKLMASAAGFNSIDDNPVALSNFVRRWLQHYQTNLTINGFSVASRDVAPTFRVTDFIRRWEQASGVGPGGVLNMRIAPFRLCAIVNRLDLRQDSPTFTAGEGRFVFCALHIPDPGPIDPLPNPDTWSPLQFTVIFEYHLLANDCEDVKKWATLWHELGSLPFGNHNSAFNHHLQKITDMFAGPHVNPHGPNRSALSQLRTNEIHFTGPWELREFRLRGLPNAQLVQTTVAQTPDNSLTNTFVLTDYVEDDLLDLTLRRHNMPAIHNGNPLLAGSSLADGTLWRVPVFESTEVRHILALNTCNGCHLDETLTGFTHVDPRPHNSESGLSAFLTGIINVNDPDCPPPGFDGAVRRDFNDLQRRADDLCDVLNSSCNTLFVTPNRATSRVH